MRHFTTLACVSMFALLAACDSPDNGYYDNNGNWVPDNKYNSINHSEPPNPAAIHKNSSQYDDNGTTTYSYDRRGYYDSNGYYMATDSNLDVPSDMFPPHGRCRVWFPDRAPVDQPGVESCKGIQSRVPMGAYVIYGG